MGENRPIWLPADFTHPEVVGLPTGHHLRPIRAEDVGIDYPAVMGSRERLWTIFGEAWGFPPETMSVEDDRADLARHEREIRDHVSFNYAILDADESHLLGCVYIDPPERVGADADICWWVVDDEVGSDLEACLTDFVPRWLASAWPFVAPRFIGRDQLAGLARTPRDQRLALSAGIASERPTPKSKPTDRSRWCNTSSSAATNDAACGSVVMSGGRIFRTF